MSFDYAAFVTRDAAREIRRLHLQAKLFQPITQRALRIAGLHAGATVLDVGCGAGDTTLLAADMVGPHGHVVGIDRSTEVLAAARERALAAGITNVSFRESELDDYGPAERFDAVIGRFVLIHQTHPAAFLRRMANLTKADGLLFCHELSFRSACFSSPPVPAWDDAVEGMVSAFRGVAPSQDVADLMARHFAAAGLSAPELICEIPMAVDGTALVCDWAVETLRSLLAYLSPEQLDQIGIETIWQRIGQGIADSKSQVAAPAQVIAWLRMNPGADHRV